MQLQKSSCHTFSNRLNRYTAFSAITLVVGLFLYGCGENWVVQCNKFVTVANKAKTLVAPKDTSGFTSLADSIEQVRTEVQAVAVQDAKLKEVQVELLGMYGDVSQALKAQVKATDAKDKTALEKAKKEFEVATGKESEIVDRINTLCSK